MDSTTKRNSGLLVIVMATLCVAGYFLYSQNQKDSKPLDAASNQEQSKLQSTLSVDAAANPYLIKTPNKDIIVSDKLWKKMEDPEVYAVNFSAKQKREGEEFEQVITVFLNTMTQDRIIGKKISDNEYLEMFSYLPNIVTMQLSRNNGTYWVLSRQSFSTSGTTLTSINPEESDQSFLLYQLHFQNEIDTTRYLLSSQF